MVLTGRNCFRRRSFTGNYLSGMGRAWTVPFFFLACTRETFTSNGDGTFARADDWGCSSGLLGPGLHVGYRAVRLGSIRLYPRCEYSYRIQYPYNDLLPVFPHNILQMGFTLALGRGANGG
jgi:hypothetical protein